MARGRNRKRKDKTAAQHLPSVSPRLLRWLGLGIAAVAISLAVAGGALRLWKEIPESQALRIRKIEFRGLERANAKELLALSPVKVGGPILTADTDEMARVLARHPWVRRAEVRRTFPLSLQVWISERKASALVDLGGLYLVDDEGVVFKRAAPGDGLDLPIVTGIRRADYIQRRAAIQPLLQGAVALAHTWREEGRDVRARLSEIRVDPGDGTTIYVGDEGTQVRLGSGDLPAKLARLDKMLSTLRAEGKKAEVLHLDNRLHPTWVTVRLAGLVPPDAKGAGSREP